MTAYALPDKQPPPLEFLTTGTVDAQPVRFFRPPELPDFPWTSWDDLCLAAGLSTERRRGLTTALRVAYPESTRLGRGERGPVLCTCHPHTQGLVQILLQSGEVPADFEFKFASIEADALTMLMDGLGSDAVISFLRGALDREGAYDK